MNDAPKCGSSSTWSEPDASQPTVRQARGSESSLRVFLWTRRTATVTRQQPAIASLRRERSPSCGTLRRSARRRRRNAGNDLRCACGTRQRTLRRLRRRGGRFRAPSASRGSSAQRPSSTSWRNPDRGECIRPSSPRPAPASRHWRSFHIPEHSACTLPRNDRIRVRSWSCSPLGDIGGKSRSESVTQQARRYGRSPPQKRKLIKRTTYGSLWRGLARPRRCK